MLRLWVVLSDYKSDVVFSEDSLESASRQYFKIRNWLRYLKNNLYNDELPDEVEFEKYFKYEELRKKVMGFYCGFEYRKAYDAIYLAVQQYSQTLTDEIKNDFYESALDSELRLKMETEMKYMLNLFTDLIYPILPFLVTELKNTKSLDKD